MDWLQFFASILGSLAWPVAVVACVLVLRRELIQLLKRLRRLRYGDAEAEFEEILEEAEEEIAELPAPASMPALGELEQYFSKELDRFSNNSAVFVSWLEVESALLNLARGAKLLERNMPTSRVAELLLRNELLDYPTHNAIRELQVLRNLAVHPNEARMITKEEADRFKRIAEKVAALLEDKRLALSSHGSRR
jgi:hypothetical protein